MRRKKERRKKGTTLILGNNDGAFMFFPVVDEEDDVVTHTHTPINYRKMKKDFARCKYVQRGKTNSKILLLLHPNWNRYDVRDDTPLFGNKKSQLFYLKIVPPIKYNIQKIVVACPHVRAPV